MATYSPPEKKKNVLQEIIKIFKELCFHNFFSIVLVNKRNN